MLTDQMSMTSIITYFFVHKYVNLSASQGLKSQAFWNINNNETWSEAL